MHVDNRLGTREDVLEGLSPELIALVMQLRELILTADPDTTEQPRPGDRALSYGVGPKKMKEGYAYIIPQKEYVNLGFYKGAALPDPEGLLEGTGKMLRHIKIHTAEDAARPGVQQLIAAAVAERKVALGEGES
ncbi:MAG: DUF1801 domain-containing protein [Chloroflexota bacterium]